MALYTKEVMDHFKNPHNMGEIEDADGVGKVGNPTCGDMMYVYIKVKDYFPFNLLSWRNRYND